MTEVDSRIVAAIEKFVEIAAKRDERQAAILDGAVQQLLPVIQKQLQQSVERADMRQVTCFAGDAPQTFMVPVGAVVRACPFCSRTKTAGVDDIDDLDQGGHGAQ